jgi:alpha-ribazole phosphatase
MTVVTRCWWIRHAPVTEDGGRIYGQTDIPANVSDAAPFAALARRLPPDAVWVASHLQRTHQTARALADVGVDLPELLIERDLAEQHLGDWQGQPRDEVFARFGERHPFWIAPARTAPPGGESFADLLGRVAPVVLRLVVEHGGRDLVLVAHGGTIRAALAVALGLDPEAATAFTIDNLSLTRIDHIVDPSHGGVWRVVAVNQSPH